jgi:hypothetical protein
MKYLFVLFMASLLAACGGGGSAGTSSGGSWLRQQCHPGGDAGRLVGDGAADPAHPQGRPGSSAPGPGARSSGKPIANQVASLSTDSTLVTPAAPTALTDANGLASVKMTPLSVAGAGSVAATMTYNTTAITGTPASYQVTPSAVTGTPTLALVLTDASGNTLATPRTFYTGSTYKARVTVLDATSAPVSNLVVNFATTGTLATISPASALTDANGVATVQIVPGTTTGADSVKASGVVNGTTYSSSAVSFQVASTSVAASLSYVVPATTPTLVVSSASAGNKLAAVSFKLTNSQGVGVSGQQVSLSLNAQSISAGVTFLVNGANTTATQTLTTDQDGLVMINVARAPCPRRCWSPPSPPRTASAPSVGLAVTNGRPTAFVDCRLDPERGGLCGGTSITQGVHPHGAAVGPTWVPDPGRHRGQSDRFAWPDRGSAWWPSSTAPRSAPRSGRLRPVRPMAGSPCWPTSMVKKISSMPTATTSTTAARPSTTWGRLTCPRMPRPGLRHTPPADRGWHDRDLGLQQRQHCPLPDPEHL